VQKIQVRKKVCDACYGVLSGMVGHEVEILTELDCKKHPLTTTPLAPSPLGSTSNVTSQSSIIQKDSSQPQPKEKPADTQKK